MYIYIVIILDVRVCIYLYAICLNNSFTKAPCFSPAWSCTCCWPLHPHHAPAASQWRSQWRPAGRPKWRWHCWSNCGDSSRYLCHSWPCCKARSQPARPTERNSQGHPWAKGLVDRWKACFGFQTSRRSTSHPPQRPGNLQIAVTTYGYLKVKHRCPDNLQSIPNWIKSQFGWFTIIQNHFCRNR